MHTRHWRVADAITKMIGSAATTSASPKIPAGHSP
jgi:hypothetical protein